MSHKDKRPDAPKHLKRVEERRGAASYKNSRGIINPLADLCKGALDIFFSAFTGVGEGAITSGCALSPGIPLIPPFVPQALPNPLYLPNNRCGHDPSNLRTFESPTHHAKRPWILVNASERLRSGFKSYTKIPRKFLACLLALNPSGNQKRSERREAFLLIIDYLLHYTDLATFFVGVLRKDRSFYYVNIDEVAQATKLSYKRTLRGLKDLQKAGYIDLIPYSSKDDTKKCYFYRIQVKDRLFLDLDVKHVSIERARAYALKEREKSNTGFVRGLKKVNGHLVQLTNKISRQLSAHRLSVEEANKLLDRQEQSEKARIAKFQELIASQPNRSRQELYEEAFGRKYPLFDTS